jgi:hypothetical protein
VKHIELTALILCVIVGSQFPNILMSRRRTPARSLADKAYFVALGNRLMRGGHIAAACKAFADAGTTEYLISLGDQYAENGMPAAARLAFMAASQANQKTGDLLRRKIRRVERTIPRSTITRC